jgi:hypothetical protein
MTSGPDHYQEAERLLAAANRRAEAGEDGLNPQTMAEAQVHATLAGVAAAIQAQFPMTHRAELAWREALGITEEEPPVVEGHAEPWAED